MHKYFNPGKFLKLSERILPAAIVITITTLICGIYYSLWGSPQDYQQGEYVRIMYVHVPSAWMALAIYVTMAAFSIAALTWKNPLSYHATIAIAPIGMTFAIICLITGSLWGKPIWGTAWVWDARLTSMLILLFFYLGYILLYQSFDNPERAGKTSAIFCIIGCVNIPVIKFSVEWWNTLHQPASILRKGGIAIDSSMLLPLMLMFASFFALSTTLFIIRVKSEILQRKIARLEAKRMR